jgi:endonuclease/exonuclease/phosphatase family metal-dependent hydrolase
VQFIHFPSGIFLKPVTRAHPCRWQGSIIKGLLIFQAANSNQKEEKPMKSTQKIPRLLIGLMLALVLVAGAVSPALAADTDMVTGPKINVMTRNLYLGADIFKLVDAAQDPSTWIPGAVAELYGTMLNTNFWARAEGIADEIANAKPQVVGLQEVETLYKQTPSDFVTGGTTPATDVVIDFYQVLNAALLARGMKYQAFTQENADVELPMYDPDSSNNFSDVRLVDHDVILVRKGIDATKLLGINYSVDLGMNIAGTDVEFKRGFLVIDVNVKGYPFRCVSTHLEVRSAVGSVYRVVQAAQMQELLGTVNYLQAIDPKPVVMVGDYNSSPEDVPGYGTVPVPGGSTSVYYVPPYMQAVAAGYLDAWLLQSKYDEGYTDGFDEDVSEPDPSLLTSRIDLVFVGLQDLFFDKDRCDVVGNQVSDMVPNPADPGYYLWPSDHAGVVAKLKFF